MHAKGSLSRRPEVVIVGGGYAGCMAAARLSWRCPQARVRVIAPAGVLVDRVRLYELLGRSPGRSLVWSLQALLGGRVELLDAQVWGASPERRELQTSAGPVRFDAVIWALGSAPTAPESSALSQGQGGAWSEVSLKGLGALRQRLPELSRRRGRALVCGGGATAYECACALRQAWPGLRVELLSPWAPRWSLPPGVTWSPGRAVSVAAQGVLLDKGGELEADAVVWAAGLRGLAGGVGGLSSSSWGRLRVDDSLRLQDADPEAPMWAVGDCAQRSDDALGGMGCKVASPMGAHAADEAARWMARQPPEAFSWRDVASVVAAGESMAWVQRAKAADSTRWARAPGALKRALHAYVIGAIWAQARGVPYLWPKASCDLKRGEP